MSEQTPEPRRKVKPRRFADGVSDNWWEALFREEATGKIHWRFSQTERFGYRLFLGVLVVLLAMFGWYFWQPRLTGVFPIKKSKFVEERRTTLPKTGGRWGETLNTEVTDPWHCHGNNSPVDNFDNFGNFWGMNRLTIEIEPEQHRQIKTLATFAGMTIKEFILSKTLTPSGAEPRPAEDTTSRLLGSPKNAKRLRKAIASKTPKHLVFETTEDLKRALGI